ncbi:MAG: metal-dependent transcriptional regulator [Verrucomicrobiae bacterium]|nr:metal-dependent transcriptional regulator [Verrucomicrobiae bacterium]
MAYFIRDRGWLAVNFTVCGGDYWREGVSVMNQMIALAVLLCFGVVLLAPRYGVWVAWKQAAAYRRRVRQEDALKFLLKSEANGVTATIGAVANALKLSRNQLARLLPEMERKGLITRRGETLQLCDPGRELAVHVVRAHRLWESYLADQSGVPENRWHAMAEKREHSISREEADVLWARLGHPIVDPHGDVIPEPGAGFEPEPGQSLETVELHVPLVISHIEDEPSDVYARIVGLGLHPGTRLFVEEKTPERIRVVVNGREKTLPRSLAGSITVRPPTKAGKTADNELRALSELGPGQVGRVVRLSPSCHGAERRRLLDLGFVPGTEVTVELIGPWGTPIAYRVRGGLVALRPEQAMLVTIEELDGVAA